MTRVADVNEFYDLLWELEQRYGHHTFADVSSWRGNPRFPQSGVYFVFERGELRAGRDDWHRVTRVGTHWVSAVRETSRATLASRLGNHRGREDGGRGDSSIFRVHIGSALTGRANWSDEGEGMAGAIPLQVSTYMRKNLSFVILPVFDAPSKDSLRRKIEVGAVRLLSNYRLEGPEVIDPPSKKWLGRKCVTKRQPDYVARSGLWNVDGVTREPDTEFIPLFKHCIKLAAA